MKKYLEYIKVLWKKPYGKAIFFFGFYVVFFIVLGILVRIDHNTTNTTNHNKTKTSVRIVDLKKYNYSFDYMIVLDGVTYNYVGSKNNSIFNYKYNDIEYYNDNNKSYTKIDSKEVENPIKFNRFFNEEIIDNIIKSAYVESKTTYDSGDTTYNLLISSNILNRIINGIDTDIEEIPNKINVSVNEELFVNKIEYKLDSYCKNNELCNNSLNITINLDNYEIS